MKQRILAYLLTLSILLGLLPMGALAAKSTIPFQDVKTTHWFYDEVKFVYDEGMMNGTGNMMFSPNASTTRGMIWTILARYAGQPTDGIPWYVAGQTWAKENNISDGTNPMGNITREQMVTMLY
ncbi:MAG: S-layer homology domain-containing protein [Bacillota bacterium]|nr:S-layer homology domain-containing protein [Bacillota bacterium]